MYKTLKMRYACYTILFFICCFWKVNCGHGRFEVLLDNITDCLAPRPPFANKRSVTINYNVHQLKGHNYISGKLAVLEEVAFRNFSIATYNVDSGQRDPKFSVEKLNCRSLPGQAFLVLANFKYTRSKCQLMKGIATFKDIDINEISHKIPSWHSTGSLVHTMQLVDRGNTILCYEIFVTVRNLD